MNHQISTVRERIRDTVDQWCHTRIRECVHCRECGSEVSPWEDVCPTCGSGAPTKVSLSAGLVLVAAFFVILLIAAVGAWLL